MEKLEAELYGQALDKYDGDQEHARYDARMELEKMADEGCEEAQMELSHKAW